jgi:ATP adenylyltransferase/5',5'''-P-1,P-4-tetraphosphate phosphorylase II
MDRWMFMVRRTNREFGDGIVGVNAMAFAGLLLARNADFVNVIENVGPLYVLENVTASYS